MKIYDNQECSKCIVAIALLKENGIEPEVINYLEIPPTAEELKSIIQKLGITALDLIRQKENIFQEKYLGKNLSEEAWIEAMIAHPILIERPIVIEGNRAVIGRPPTKVLTIINAE